MVTKAGVPIPAGARRRGCGTRKASMMTPVEMVVQLLGPEASITLEPALVRPCVHPCKSTIGIFRLACSTQCPTQCRESSSRGSMIDQRQDGIASTSSKPTPVCKVGWTDMHPGPASWRRVTSADRRHFIDARRWALAITRIEGILPPSLMFNAILP